MIFQLAWIFITIRVLGQYQDQDNWYLWQTSSPGFSPYGVTIGTDGRIFAGTSSGMIQVCSNGVWSIFVSNTFAPGLSFSQPLGMITDTASNLYVAPGPADAASEWSI